MAHSDDSDAAFTAMMVGDDDAEDSAHRLRGRVVGALVRRWRLRAGVLAAAGGAGLALVVPQAAGRLGPGLDAAFAALGGGGLPVVALAAIMAPLLVVIDFAFER